MAKELSPRGPGRPRKYAPPDPDAPKRGPGRPKKGEIVEKRKLIEDEGKKPGNNSKSIRTALIGMRLPAIDISNPRHVEKRINDYLEYCIQNDNIPSIPGMAVWLGVCPDTVHDWKNGRLRKSTHQELIRKYATIIEQVTLEGSLNNSLNVGGAIFALKNGFGYKDTQDIVITPNNPLGDVQDPDVIAAKYAELPPD